MVLDRDKCLYGLDKAKMRYNREDEYLAIIQNSLDPTFGLRYVFRRRWNKLPDGYNLTKK
jgi:hypothetical protein